MTLLSVAVINRWFDKAFSLVASNCDVSSLGTFIIWLLYTQAISVYEKLVEIDHHPIAARHILNALKGKTTDSAPLSYIQELYDGFAGHFEKRLVGDLCYDIPHYYVVRPHTIVRLQVVLSPPC